MMLMRRRTVCEVSPAATWARCSAETCLGWIRGIVLQDPQLVAVNGKTCELAGGIGASVDPDAVRPKFRRARRGVAVDDDLAEIVLTAQKRLADFQHIFLALPVERDARPYPGVNKIEIAVTCIWKQ